MSRRRFVAVAGVGAVAAAAAGGVVAANRRGADAGTAAVAGVPTGTAMVKRVDVAERRQVTGALGYAGEHNVIAPGAGVLTQLPPLGTTVVRGQPLYEVDGRPVVLLYGDRPAWRAFENGMPGGPDVAQLEDNLNKLGHGVGLTVDQRFTGATSLAIQRFQRACGLPVTGSVPLGQVVFLPGPVRIGAHEAQLGAPLEPGAVVVRGTGDQPVITFQVPPQQLSNATADSPVVVTLPDGATRPGRITAIGAVAQPPGDGGQPTVRVTVQAEGALTGFVDQAQVRVALTLELHPAVLAVPITALNAAPGGAYEVIIVDGGAARRVPVRTGLFDEFTGLAEVSGPGLAEGQRVQVPRDDA